jgi:hypothetical protein
VKHLVQDSNIWDIGLDLPVPDGGFEHYLEEGHFDNFDYDWTTDSVNSHQQIWEARYHDELETLKVHLYPGPNGFTAILVKFPALHGVGILNGIYEIEDGIGRKIDDEIKSNGLDAVQRGDDLFAGGNLGTLAFQRVIEGFSHMQRPWELKADALDYSFFSLEKYIGHANPDVFASKLQHLFSLSLTLSMWRREPFEGNGPEVRLQDVEECDMVLKLGYPKHLLEAMTPLQSLHLTLSVTLPITAGFAGSMGDLIPLHEGWTKLCNRSLTAMETTEGDFVSLMHNHGSTLEHLHHQLIWLSNNNWLTTSTPSVRGSGYRKALLSWMEKY